MSFTEWMAALGQVVLVVAVAFVVLCALTSFIRFQFMSEHAMETQELGSSEARGFRLVIMNQIPVARRARVPFSVVLLQLPENGIPATEVEPHVKPLIRKGDIIMPCGEHLVGLMLMCGSDVADVPVNRIIKNAEKANVVGSHEWRLGVAGYPDHGFKTSVIYERALEMVNTAGEKASRVVGMASKEDVKEETDPNKNAAGIDELTGLVSEDKMLAVFRRFIAQERRQDLPVSLIYMEVDQPERLLDQYGKAEVNGMIKEFAAFLDKNIRGSDIIARFGETGFVMTLSTKPASAVLLTQRIIEDVRRMAFKAGHGMKISVSAGVAGYPDVMGTVVQYFVSAESALQVARTRGRSQCVRFDRHLQVPIEDDKTLEKI